MQEGITKELSIEQQGMEKNIRWNGNHPSKEVSGSISMETEKDQTSSHGKEQAGVNENHKNAKPSFREIVARSSQWFSEARKIMLTSME